MLNFSKFTQISYSLIDLCRITAVSILLNILYSLESLFPNIFAPRKIINQQHVLVTGSGSGLGRLLAVKFAHLGAKLILVDENEASNEETAELVRTVANAEAFPFTCDLSKRKEVYRTLDLIISQVGNVDILINNASAFVSKLFIETSDDEINRNMAINCLSHCWIAHAILPKMLEKKRGHLVTIASAAGIVASSNLTSYSASKHAAVGFHRALDMELDAMGAENIHSTLICPYYIRSERTEGLKTRFNWFLPIIEPDEAANRIVEAILRNRKFMGLPSTIHVFFAIQNILPVGVAHYIARCFGLIQTTCVTMIDSKFSAKH